MIFAYTEDKAHKENDQPAGDLLEVAAQEGLKVPFRAMSCRGRHHRLLPLRKSIQAWRRKLKIYQALPSFNIQRQNRA